MILHKKYTRNNLAFRAVDHGYTYNLFKHCYDAKLRILTKCAEKRLRLVRLSNMRAINEQVFNMCKKKKNTLKNSKPIYGVINSNPKISFLKFKALKLIFDKMRAKKVAKVSDLEMSTVPV